MTQPPLQVGRDQRDRQREREQHERDDGGHERQRERVAAAEEAPVQAEAADDHRDAVGQVGQDQERDRLVGDRALGHPGAPQRPRGQHQPAGAAGREQA